MAVRDAGAVQRLPGPAPGAESAPSLICPITLDAKHAGERSAGKPPAPFDVAGAGNVTMEAGPASATTLEHPPEPRSARRSSTLPVRGEEGKTSSSTRSPRSAIARTAADSPAGHLPPLHAPPAR